MKRSNGEMDNREDECRQKQRKQRRRRGNGERKDEMEGLKGSEKEVRQRNSPEKTCMKNDACQTTNAEHYRSDGQQKTTRKMNRAHQLRNDALQQTAPDSMLDIQSPRCATETKTNQCETPCCFGRSMICGDACLCC